MEKICTYITPAVKVVALNTRHSILLDTSVTGGTKNEQLGNANGWGEDFWSK